MKPGVSVAQLNAALGQKRLEEIRREGSKGYAEKSGWSMFAQPWTQDAAGDLRKPLFALFAVVGAVLLIACANVAGLLLARTAGRMRELAIRAALGASVFQITSLFLVETSLLAVGAAVIAVLAGPILGRLLLLSIPNHLADGFVVRSDPRLLAVTIGFSLLAAFLAGVAPAVQVARMQRKQRLSEFGRSVTSGSARQRLRVALVSTEIALAFVLLAGTGMFLMSLKQLQRVDPGFRTEGVLTGSVTLSGGGYADNKANRASLVRDVVQRVSEQPGVVAVGASSNVPFSGTGMWGGSFAIQNKPAREDEPGPHSDRRCVTPGYLSAMQIPLQHGRWFTEDDRDGTLPVAVIDDVLAKAYWPGQNPIGEHVRMGSRSPWLEVVGVVGHVRRDSLEVDENKGVLYMPFEQNPVPMASFVVRTKGDPQAMEAPLVKAVQSVDATEAIYDVRTLSSMVSESLAARQLLVWLLSLFGGLALLLAAIGIYGLLSYMASQRAPEIGIRMALGAQRWQIAELVVKEMLWMVGAGLAVGVVAALTMQRVLAHLFAGRGAGIVPSLAVAAAGLLVAAVLAVAIPARRSASVEPAVVLRAE
jgi:predicted permease